MIVILLALGLLFAAGCGATPTATLTPTQTPVFEVSVSDAGMNFTVTQYTTQRDTENGVVSVTFATLEGQSVQVFFEPAAEPGNVTLVASTDAMNPQRQPQNGVWLLVQAAPTASGAEPVYYSKDPVGSFVLTTRSTVLSGTFEVTLANAEGLTLTVFGNFSDIAV